MKTTNTKPAANLENYVERNISVPPQSAVFSEFGFRRFSTECSQKLADLKNRVAADLANQFSTLNARLIYQAVNEADSLAATTPFPALLLPALAEEKVRNASAWVAKQRAIRDETLALAA